MRLLRCHFGMTSRYRTSFDDHKILCLCPVSLSNCTPLSCPLSSRYQLISSFVASCSELNITRISTKKVIAPLELVSFFRCEHLDRIRKCRRLSSTVLRARSLTVRRRGQSFQSTRSDFDSADNFPHLRNRLLSNSMSSDSIIYNAEKT